jgi:hypothetical protein
MLRRPALPPAPAALPRPRLRLVLLLVPLVLLIAGGATGLLNHPRGWVMFALACAALGMVARHQGGTRLARLGEYAVIAVLAVLLVTGTGVTKPALPHSRGRTAAGAAQLCPPTVQGVAGSACGALSDLWAKAKRAAKTAGQQAAKPSPTTAPTRKDNR